MTCTACQLDAPLVDVLPAGELHAGEPLCQPCADFRRWAELADVDYEAAREMRRAEPDGKVAVIYDGDSDD